MRAPSHRYFIYLSVFPVSRFEGVRVCVYLSHCYFGAPLPPSAVRWHPPARGGKDRQTTQTRNTQTDTETQTETPRTQRENNEGYRNGVSLTRVVVGGVRERPWTLKTGGGITDENLSEGMAIGEETSPSARREPSSYMMLRVGREGFVL